MPHFDYLLAVGPGRSGTDFLFSNLRRHPQFRFPEIKEGEYYLSDRRYRRRRSAIGPDQILTDISNRAYKDHRLVTGVQELRRRGQRVLILVMLRDHLDRARSTVSFRKSRMEFSTWFGSQSLEKSVVCDRLTAAHLDAISGIGCTVAVVDFNDLTTNPKWTLNKLARMCGTSPFETVNTERVNVAEISRNQWLVLIGRLTARTMRRLGARRQLQRAKDSVGIRGLFYASATGSPEPLRMSLKSVEKLREANLACWEFARRRGLLLTVRTLQD